MQWAEDKASASIDAEASASTYSGGLSPAHRTCFLSDATERLHPMVPSAAAVSGVMAVAAVTAAPRAPPPLRHSLPPPTVGLLALLVVLVVAAPAAAAPLVALWRTGQPCVWWPQAQRR